MKKSPQSAAQAARPNASTGPRSAEGKARSSMNALKTGIYSKSLIIPSEDPAQLTTLTEEYFQHYCPALPEQRDLVDILVRSTWTLRRLAVAEAQVFTHQMDRANHLDKNSPIGHAFCLSDRTLARLQRMVNSTQRNFRDALREIQRLQALDLHAQPAPRPDSPHPGKGSQSVETKPVNQPREFVSSTSSPPPSSTQKAAPKASPKPLPFHLPGSQCDFTPFVPSEFKRCPICFPGDDSPDAQE